MDDESSGGSGRSQQEDEQLIKSTACLGWIRGLLASHLPPKRSDAAGGHFTRICCAILASHSAGGLCFNASGVIIVDLLRLLLPLIDFGELDKATTDSLPLDVLSLYDL